MPIIFLILPSPPPLSPPSPFFPHLFLPYFLSLFFLPLTILPPSLPPTRHNGKIHNYRVTKDQVDHTFFIHNLLRFASVADLIAYYRQYPTAAGFILIKPVGASISAVKRAEDSFTERPGKGRRKKEGKETRYMYIQERKRKAVREDNCVYYSNRSHGYY